MCPSTCVAVSMHIGNAILEAELGQSPFPGFMFWRMPFASTIIKLASHLALVGIQSWMSSPTKSQSSHPKATLEVLTS